MNYFQMFIGNSAIVEIRRYYRDDLYNFCKLIEMLGFLNNEIEHFEKVFKIKEENTLLEESYCDDYFWHIVDINTTSQNVYIEYQYGKGFTFGGAEDYKISEEDYKKISVNDLIVACNKEAEFNLGYIETDFIKELTKEQQDLAIILCDFCEWYEWQLVKYNNGKYNILDIQTEEFDFAENESLEEMIKRVFFRMVDYFTDEEEHEDYYYTEKSITEYITLGTKYKLLDNDYVKYLKNWFAEEKKYLKNC